MKFNPSTNGKGPLADVRVLDLTSVLMGPFATQLLGDSSEPTRA